MLQCSTSKPLWNFARGWSCWVRDGDAAAALLDRCAARPNATPWKNPYYLSYFGLGLGHAEGMWPAAERICHMALCRGRRQAQLYLNLAEVYIASNRRQAAADTLSRGLHYLPHDIRLQAEFEKLGVRRAPVLRHLPRAHFLNRSLGRLRHRMLHRMPPRKWLTIGESRA